MRLRRPGRSAGAACSRSIRSLQDECRFRAERQSHGASGTDLISVCVRVLREDHQPSNIGLDDVLRRDAYVGALEDTTGNPVDLGTVHLNLFRSDAYLIAPGGPVQRLQ